KKPVMPLAGFAPPTVNSTRITRIRTTTRPAQRTTLARTPTMDALSWAGVRRVALSPRACSTMSGVSHGSPSSGYARVTTVGSPHEASDESGDHEPEDRGQPVGHDDRPVLVLDREQAREEQGQRDRDALDELVERIARVRAEQDQQDEDNLEQREQRTNTGDHASRTVAAGVRPSCSSHANGIPSTMRLTLLRTAQPVTPGPQC